MIQMHKQENKKLSTINSSKKISVIIIGGGLSGLITAQKLSKKFNVTIIDKQKFLGGLATSIKYNGYSMDIGPHILSLPKNSQILDEFSTLMNDEELIELTNISNASKAYFNSQFFDSFPTLSNTLYHSGKFFFIKILFELFIIKLKNKRHKYSSSKDYLISCYGNLLYNKWFKPFLFSRFFSYDVPLEYIQNIFPPVSFNKMINSLFLNTKPTKPISIVNDTQLHYYFKNGMISFIDKIKKNIQLNGGKIILNADIKNIIHDKSKKIILSIDNQTQEISSDIIIYAIPSSLIIKWFDPPEEIKLLTENPKSSLNCIMAFLCINSPKLPYGWIINIYDNELVFFRITQQNFLSTSIAPNGKSILCIEIRCSENSEIWKKSNDDIFKIIKNDLRKMNFFNVDTIEDKKMIKFKNLYPIGINTVDQTNVKINKFLNSFTNEYVLGTIEGDTGRLSNLDKDNDSNIGEGGITLAIINANKLITKILNTHSY